MKSFSKICRSESTLNYRSLQSYKKNNAHNIDSVRRIVFVIVLKKWHTYDYNTIKKYSMKFWMYSIAVSTVRFNAAKWLLHFLESDFDKLQSRYYVD